MGLQAELWALAWLHMLASLPVCCSELILIAHHLLPPPPKHRERNQQLLYTQFCAVYANGVC